MRSTEGHEVLGCASGFIPPLKRRPCRDLLNGYELYCEKPCLSSLEPAIDIRVAVLALSKRNEREEV